MKIEEILEKRIRAAIELIHASDIPIEYRIEIRAFDLRGAWFFKHCWEPSKDEF